ncbi:hypothetical protein LCGC14_1732280 [marine sediment metagenome]|uniref:Uncharacterized protein n=1 Tax=marine sediment metagenome TaxID=412755 RepID=A0A0F9K8W0_9ZZZZ
MDNRQHINQCNYNESVINWCRSNNFPFNDWIIIVTFYTALHKLDFWLHSNTGLIDREITEYFNPRGKKFTGHGARNKNIINEFGTVAPYYIDLYRECRRVRYKQFSLNKITSADLNKYINIWFNVIKNFTP